MYELERADLYDRLRTLRGAAVSLDLLNAVTDEANERAAAVTQRAVTEGEEWHTLAGAISMLISVINLIVEASHQLDGDDIVNMLRRHIAAHMTETTDALRALDTQEEN